MNWKVPKDMAGQEERIRELEQEIERLRAQRDHYEKGLHGVRGRCAKLMKEGHDYGGYYSIRRTVEDYLENCPDALDGGGGADD
jgi:chromosome segregation ATPase